MHAPGHGIARSARPYRTSPPTWCKIDADSVKSEIFKLAKKGLPPSQIGVALRDSNGIPEVQAITGSKILRILRVHGLAAALPEVSCTHFYPLSSSPSICCYASHGHVYLYGFYMFASTRAVLCACVALSLLYILY